MARGRYPEAGAPGERGAGAAAGLRRLLTKSPIILPCPVRGGPVRWFSGPRVPRGGVPSQAPEYRGRRGRWRPGGVGRPTRLTLPLPFLRLPQYPSESRLRPGGPRLPARRFPLFFTHPHHVDLVRY